MGPILLHPSYWPSITQMVHVAQSEAVIFEYCDNYQKQTYRNRAYIAHANGRLSLNVPVLHNSNGARQKSRSVKTDGRFPWAEQHWKSLQSAYRSSPYFEYYEDELIDLFSKMDLTLMDHNIRIFERLSELLGLEVSWSFTSSYTAEPSKGVIDLRRLINAKKQTNCNLSAYTQVLQPSGDFLPDLSILDLLFNEGPNSLSYLEEQSPIC